MATKVARLGSAVDGIYIGRGSIYGNPYIIGKHGDRAKVIALFRDLWYSDAYADVRATADAELKDKVLLCYCSPKSCHGDVIAEYVDKRLLF